MLPDRLCRLLTAHVDGELDARQQETVLKLLRESPEARALFEQLKDDANHIRDLPPHKLDPDFTERVLEQLGRRPIRPVIRYDHPAVATRLHMGIGLATAAAMVLVVGLGSFYFLKKGSAEAPVALRHEQAFPDVPGKPEPAEENRLAADKAESPPVRIVSPPEGMPADPSSVAARGSPVERPADQHPKLEPSPSGALTAPIKGTPSIDRVAIEVAIDLQPSQLEREDLRQKLLDKLRAGKTQRLEFECRQTALGMKTLREALESEGIGLLVDKRAETELRAYDLRLPSKMDYAVYTENVTAEEVLRMVQKIGDQDRAAQSHHRSPLFNGLSVNAPTKQEITQLSQRLGFDPLQPEPRRSGKPDPRKPLAEETMDQVLESLKSQRTSRPQAGRAGGRQPDRLAIVVACTAPFAPADPQVIQVFQSRRQNLQSGCLQLLVFVRGPN
jgi:anti-sigma factor RsiW